MLSSLPTYLPEYPRLLCDVLYANLWEYTASPPKRERSTSATSKVAFRRNTFSHFYCRVETRILAAISSVHSSTLACIQSRATPADYYHVQIPSIGKCLAAVIQPKYEFEKSTISSASLAAVLMAESTRPKLRIENSLARIRMVHTRNASFLPSRSKAPHQAHL